MTPHDLEDMINSADWADVRFKSIAQALVDLWRAAEENQHTIATIPWRVDDSQKEHLTFCSRNIFRGWMLGSSTRVDLALSKLRCF